MAVSRADVLHVAALARLAVDHDEAERLATELTGILEHMDALRTADLSGVPPMAGAAGAREAPPARAEPDLLVTPPADTAPGWQDGFFTVPRLPHASGQP
jgi:aspartyl-tRNA(Asn)/glutamyl-tRNA(Gln) amidotransferase subunit C